MSFTASENVHAQRNYSCINLSDINQNMPSKKQTIILRSSTLSTLTSLLAASFHAPSGFCQWQLVSAWLVINVVRVRVVICSQMIIYLSDAAYGVNRDQLRQKVHVWGHNVYKTIITCGWTFNSYSSQAFNCVHVHITTMAEKYPCSKLI